MLSVLGPSSLAQLLGRKIQEAGVDADMQQWFHDSPVAPQPTRLAIITERMERLFFEMVTLLGFETGAFDDWRATRSQLLEQ